MHIYDHTRQNKIPENNIMKMSKSFKCCAYKNEDPRIVISSKETATTDDEVDDDDTKKRIRTFIHSSIHLYIHRYWIDRLFCLFKAQKYFLLEQWKNALTLIDFLLSVSSNFNAFNICIFGCFFSIQFFFFFLLFLPLYFLWWYMHIYCVHHPFPFPNKIHFRTDWQLGISFMLIPYSPGQPHNNPSIDETFSNGILQYS